MATRARQSAGPSTPAASQASQARRSTAGGNNAEPQYEPPQFSMNPAAQRALAQLARTHGGQKLQKSLDEACVQVTESAADINEAIYERNKSLLKTREKRGEDAEDGSLEDLEKELQQMREKVKAMTDRMEHKMRRLIDGKHDVQRMDDAIIATGTNARNNASTQASTVNTRSQRTRRNRDANDDEEDGASDDEELPDFQPTDPAAASPQVQPPLEFFQKNADDMKLRYQDLDLTTRYAEHEDYVNFKRSVHHALYPDDDVQLPPASQWFNDDGTVAELGVTGGRTTQAGEEDDSDDDLAISRANISTKCALSLMEFVEPITSRKCPHSFEKRYILEFIDGSSLRLPAENGRQGAKAARCPLPSCEAMLAKSDLFVDPVLVRKIKRLQRAKEMEMEEDDEEEEDGAPNGTQRRAAHQIIDDDDEEDDDRNLDAYRTQPKREPRASYVSATQIPVDAEEEQEDDEMYD